MSKIPVIHRNENIFEKEILCPHNKIVGKVQKIYRVEKPVRLKEVSHLRKLGQCDCPICGTSNKLICECKWKKETFFHNNKRQQHQYGGVGAARTGRGIVPPGVNDEKTKDESIFRFHTMPPPPDDYDEYPLRQTGPTGNILFSHTLGGCRSTLINKFRQSCRRSCNYLAGRVKSAESFNWIMKPICDFRISSVNITGLQQVSCLTQATNNPYKIGNLNHPHQTGIGSYKEPIDVSSGSSWMQQQHKYYNNNKSRSECTYKSSATYIAHKDTIGHDNDLMYTIMDNQASKNYDTIKILNNNRYLKSVADKYPSNMRPGQSEQESTEAASSTIEPIKSWKPDKYAQQSQKQRQQQKQQTFIEPFTTIEVYDNKIDLEVMQYKPSSSKQQQQKETTSTSSNVCQVRHTTDKGKNSVACYDKMKLASAKATNLDGDNLDDIEAFDCTDSIPSVIAVPADAFVKLKRNSFQSLKSSLHSSSHNLNNPINQNPLNVNSNVAKITSPGSGVQCVNVKPNSSVAATSQSKRGGTNPIKNEATKSNIKKKIDGNGNIHKPINTKKPKGKNSKVTIKKRRLKK